MWTFKPNNVNRMFWVIVFFLIFVIIQSVSQHLQFEIHLCHNKKGHFIEERFLRHFNRLILMTVWAVPWHSSFALLDTIIVCFLLFQEKEEPLNLSVVIERWSVTSSNNAPFFMNISRITWLRKVSSETLCHFTKYRRFECLQQITWIRC